MYVAIRDLDLDGHHYSQGELFIMPKTSIISEKLIRNLIQQTFIVEVLPSPLLKKQK